MKKSLIGRGYIPFDNSFEVDLTHHANNRGDAYGKHGQLSGTNKKDSFGTWVKDKPTATDCIILTEPFKCFVNNIFQEVITREMIIVNSGGRSYMTIFEESNIIPD